MDKRTDINTASFAYSVSLLRIRISGYPPGAGTKRQSIHTAVLHGIAVFFCSTFFTTFHHYFISYDDFCHACASAFMQVLFLFVGKCRVVIYTTVQRSLLRLSRADQRQNCRHMYRSMGSKDWRKSLLCCWSRSGHWTRGVWMIILAG